MIIQWWPLREKLKRLRKRVEVALVQGIGNVWKSWRVLVCRVLWWYSVYKAYSWLDPGINLKRRVKDNSNIFILWPEEMASGYVHFLCKLGDLSSDPQHLHEIQTWTCVCNPSVRRQRQADPKSLMTLSSVRDLNSGRIWWTPQVFSFTQPTLTWCWIHFLHQNQNR